MTSAAKDNFYRGYSEEQIRSTFDAICDPEDWKAPISAPVNPKDDMVLYEAAIEFYTATQCKFKMIGNQLHVMSLGYRMGPAGP